MAEHKSVMISGERDGPLVYPMMMKVIAGCKTSRTFINSQAMNTEVQLQFKTFIGRAELANQG